MGTRGLMGVRINGVDKLAYNHSDSCPKWLGNHINDATFYILNTPDMGMEWLREKAEELQPVEDEDGGETHYKRLRHLQGELIRTLEFGEFFSNGEFIQDSLFCEWVYIVNIDTQKIEVYKGFQRQKHDKGRFADLPSYEPYRDADQFYPCALVLEVPFDSLQKSAENGNCAWVESLINKAKE